MTLYIALQSVLHVLEKWADNINMFLNTTKTNKLVTVRAKKSETYRMNEKCDHHRE